MILRLLGAFIAAYGFGYIYNIKGKKLTYVSIGGLLGAFIYEMCIVFNISEFASLLLSSIGISLYAEIMARYLKTPVTGFILIALIILVPGGGMYYTMLYALSSNIDMSILVGIDTLAKAGCLALGAIIVSSVKKLFIKKI
ncbi:MAG: threonine/serine exporter family protein [Erysipelotrichaceae bacterium]|nr:threonine/serine exporter family protein [Erysipelotrichaceae bacterium]